MRNKTGRRMSCCIFGTQDRLKAVIKEVTDSDGGIILFIDEIHTVVGAGASEGSMDAGAPPARSRASLHRQPLCPETALLCWTGQPHDDCREPQTQADRSV